MYLGVSTDQLIKKKQKQNENPNPNISMRFGQTYECEV